MTESEDTYSELAAMFKAAGDPMRMEMLRMMERNSFGVLELCRIFLVQQPSMSHHLKVLSKAGLVATRREGNSIFYRRASSDDWVAQERLTAFFSLLDRDPLRSERLASLSDVQEARRAQAMEFFQTNAHRFREQQDLIAGHKDYGALVAEKLAASDAQSWLEVGPGDGELLRDCAAEFERVYALDISEELLAQSQRNLPEPLRSRVEFVLGDTQKAQAEGIRVDRLSCNMVLHHVPSPAAMVQDMATLMEPKGRLVITDLDQHDQDWARDACGDLWLGFMPEQLNDWASEAGLTEGNSEFLALRNGFRVQIREYIKA